LANVAQLKSHNESLTSKLFQLNTILTSGDVGDLSLSDPLFSQDGLELRLGPAVQSPPDPSGAGGGHIYAFPPSEDPFAAGVDPFANSDAFGGGGGGGGGGGFVSALLEVAMVDLIFYTTPRTIIVLVLYSTI
jgi:hypothetical protein